MSSGTGVLQRAAFRVIVNLLSERISMKHLVLWASAGIFLSACSGTSLSDDGTLFPSESAASTETSAPATEPLQESEDGLARSQDSGWKSSLAATCQPKEQGGSPEFCDEHTARWLSGFIPSEKAYCHKNIGGPSPWAKADHEALGDRSFYAEIKTAIWNLTFDANNRAPKDATFAECRADYAVALAMQETAGFGRVSFDGNLPYDANKDWQTNGAQNLSIFNMNVNFVQMSCEARHGTASPYCKAFTRAEWGNTRSKMYLNQYRNLPEAIRRLNEGLDYFGQNEAIHFHRGGYGGWASPGNDEWNFVKSIADAATRLVPQHRKTSFRIAHNIGYR